MSDAIRVALTPAQVEEFQTLAKDEQTAKQTLDRIPVAQTYAARAIVLSAYPLAMIAGQALHVDYERAVITFTPNVVTPSSPLALVDHQREETG